MKPSTFLTLLNCCSFMLLASSLSFTYRHEALSSSMAQARNGRPFMPTCGQVFAAGSHHGKEALVAAGWVQPMPAGPARMRIPHLTRTHAHRGRS